jgi:hypothetical protein
MRIVALLPLACLGLGPIPAWAQTVKVGAVVPLTGCGHRLLEGQCLRMADYVKVRPIGRCHPALGSVQRPFVLATLETPRVPEPLCLWSLLDKTKMIVQSVATTEVPHGL